MKSLVKNSESLSNNKSDESLISILQNLPVGVIIFTSNSILFINKAAINILKPSKELQKKLTNYSVFDFLLPEYHKIVKEKHLKIKQGEELAKFELKVRNGKNEIIDLEVKTNEIIFNGRKAFQTVFSDISERVKYQRELLEIQQNFINITENTNDIVYFFTYLPKPKYIYISPVIKNILGYTDSDFYKNPDICKKLVVNKKDYLKFELALLKLQKNNTLTKKSSTFQYKTKSGKLVWLEDSYSPIHDDEGKIKFILGISRDITKEKTHKIELEQKWSNYENLLETSPIGVFIHLKGICLYCNKTAQNILEERNRKKIIGSNLINDILPEYRTRAINRMQKAINGEEQADLTYKIKTRKGTILEVDLKTVPLVYNGERCVQTIISNTSVEKKLTEETLRAQLAEKTNKELVKVINQRKVAEAKLQAVFNTSTHIIWTIDRKYNFTSFNQNYILQLKLYYNYELNINDNLKKLYKKIIDHKTYIYWIDKYEKAFNGENVRFETEKMLDDGNFIFREIYLNPVFDEHKNVIEVVALSHNITERKVNEIKTKEQAAKLNAIFESGNQLIWSINKDKTLNSFNQNYAKSKYEIYGVYPTLGIKITEISDPLLNEKYTIALNGKPVDFISETINKKGDKITRQMFLYPIKDSKNNVLEVSGISFDITENKKNEEKIKQSLKEKEILLKEVHHRVKNNLQVISSILNLQSSYIKDEYAINVLKESQNRIKTMAFIHESLYQNKNFESVNFSEYISALSKNLINSYSTNSKKIKLILTLDDLALNLDTSIPCGLIVNEIISNSLKYAFPNNSNGIIFVNLKTNQKQVKIEVGDNGIGIPKEINIKNTKTLGLQLVDTLVEQINGSYFLDRSGGTKFIIQFKN